MIQLAVVAGILLVPAPAAAPARQVVEWTLPNGLQVAYLRVSRMPVVAVQVWVHAGARDDPEGRSGTAHMFEHIMFKGSEHVPADEHVRLIDRAGGSTNAFTSDDMTAFQEVVPRGDLDFALLLEADRLRGLLFRASMIATEKEVVKEEIRHRDENDPVGTALARLRAAAFTTHPYRRRTGGSLEDLDRTTPEDLKRFYDLYYQPGNVLVVVVGDVAEDEVRAAVDKRFGPIPRAPDPLRPAREAKEPPQTALRRETSRPAPIGIVMGGWKIPEARSPDLIPLAVAVAILSGGDSSRLYQRLVRRDKTSVAAGAALIQTEDPGLLYAFGAHLAPEQADKVESALVAEAERLGRERVGARELEKAKNQIAARKVFAQGDVAAIARQIGEAKLLRGDASAWMKDLDAIVKVTATDVQRVAKAYLARTNLTIVRVPPRGER